MSLRTNASCRWSQQSQSFLHPVHCLILEQELVIFRDGHQEEDCSDILKAVDPFLALRTLATNIEHPVGKLPNDECSLRNTSSLDTGAQHILIVGKIIRLSNSVDGVEVTVKFQ